MKKLLLVASVVFAANLVADDFEDGKAALVKGDYHQAHVHFEKACNEGNQKACVGFAGLYENGRDVEKDIAKAKEMYKTACDAGEELGCKRLEKIKE